MSISFEPSPLERIYLCLRLKLATHWKVHLKEVELTGRYRPIYVSLNNEHGQWSLNVTFSENKNIHLLFHLCRIEKP